MLETQTPSIASFTTLPAEIILDLLPYIPFTPQTLSSLSLTCSRLSLLIKHHQRSLISSIKQIQIPPTSLALFPSLQTHTYAGLATLHSRLTALEDLHAQWLRITSHGPELDWLKGRWEAIHKTGLLLLYRLHDSKTHPNKVALLDSFPATSLACLLFKLLSSIKILRIYGPAPINGTHAAGDVLARSDIELAFEEMLLQHGPDFFIATLRYSDDPPHPKSQWAISALETEISGMIERQSPSPDGIPKPPTLTSCLRRAFAARCGCHISHNIAKMWEILASTSFDEIDDEKMVHVVNGEELQGGMKRVF